MDFLIIFDNVASLAGFIGSLTVIGSALIWVYKKLIAGPKEKRDVKRAEIENAKFREAIKPTAEAVEQISRSLAYQESRDQKLQEIADRNVKLLAKHEDRLDRHNERLIVLETRNGITRTYHEVYKGGNEDE